MSWFKSNKDFEDRKSQKELDAEWEEEIRKTHKGEVFEKNNRMMSKHCAILGTNCLGEGCVHFKSAHIRIMKDLRWFNVDGSACRLWK